MNRRERRFAQRIQRKETPVSLRRQVRIPFNPLDVLTNWQQLLQLQQRQRP